MTHISSLRGGSLHRKKARDANKAAKLRFITSRAFLGSHSNGVTG
ncbi:hypothetical protein HMPREF0733_11223 [Rothia dentocariosa ATCC 17931]|uniref:Uncharacterized protein n=1 Tax=Rothia dentocariosa (strain ATCC 17931 / CDC X599 / XDIA) TaxID=762948 RepID=E3H4P7_ROTDC|nr:hypothetical protein HMPREF0733_11223 [Rothia dentocariosa ATCC 17931]